MSDNPYAAMNLDILKRREAGAVSRFSTVPQSGHYTTSQHNHGALTLLLLLNPTPSLNLVRAVHDMGLHLRWLGEIPTGALKIDVLRDAYAAASAVVTKELNAEFELSEDEKRWVFAVDLLAVYYWCFDQLAVGNQNVRPMFAGVRAQLQGLDMPEACKLAFSAAEWGRVGA